jgi:integrase
MGTVKIRHLIGRASKQEIAYYWVPTTKLRRAGFLIRRLSGDIAKAIAEAEALNEKLDPYYAGKPIGPVGPASGTLAALDHAFQSNRAFRKLGKSTQNSYCYGIKTALKWAGDMQVAKISRKAIMTWVNAIYDPKEVGGTGIGPGNARNAAVAFRRPMSFGHDSGWTNQNLALKLSLPVPPNRSVVWTEDQMRTFLATAKSRNRPSMALAVLLGWCLGQRPADLRVLAWSAYARNSFAIRQKKTGKLIAVPALPELRAALEAAPRISTQIVVSEATGRPYQESAFQHLFAEIRQAAKLPEELQVSRLAPHFGDGLGRGGLQCPPDSSCDRTCDN